MILKIDMEKYRAQVQRLFGDVLNEAEMEKMLGKAVRKSVFKAINPWEQAVWETYHLRNDEAQKGLVKVSGFSGKAPGGALRVTGYSRALTRADYTPSSWNARHSGTGTWPRPQARSRKDEPLQTLQGAPQRFGRDMLVNPFVLRFRSGHEAIASRVEGKGRLPLKQRYATPIPSMFGNEDTFGTFEEQLGEHIDQYFYGELQDSAAGMGVLNPR